MVKAPYAESAHGLYRVLIKGLLRLIQGVLTTARMDLRYQQYQDATAEEEGEFDEEEGEYDG